MSPIGPVQSLLSDRHIRLIKTKAEAEPEEKEKKESAEEEHIPLHERRFQFKTSCALYNFQTVISRCIEMEVPIVLKEYRPIYKGSKLAIKERLVNKSPPVSLYYSTKSGQRPVLLSQEEVKKWRKLAKAKACFMLECRFHEDIEKMKANIEKIGLLELIKANLAGVQQYSSDSDVSGLDEEGQREVAKYKKMCDELGCQSLDPKIFAIVHTHAVTVKIDKRWVNEDEEPRTA